MPQPLLNKNAYWKLFLPEVPYNKKLKNQLEIGADVM